ncbi:Uma2 family endonuclease [Ferruginibacter sp. HRS2-29]|uniref:Uma2 family endonuclease n=1 Tax=Ferruginibacter sp. HRS2-29 TaxID=2487334 RepID=UPI0020CE45FB|nr:Uma2 family endonuclease [Ferruginibacter sp. HRS2-29]MCP9751512.1 Uma2 family endonuclease [Ferruginibacter sp. HRS2-29]
MDNVTEEPAVKYNHFSPEEYLAMEREATEKHEYYQGEIFAMSGASINHSKIATRITGELISRLRGKPCQPYNNDLRIHIPKNTLYTYPDISIICGEPQTTDSSLDTVTNPSVIIEILSKSTANYDLGQKFSLYREIVSLKEYIIIDSESIFVQKNIRNSDNSWLVTYHDSIEVFFVIDTVHLNISLQDIYEGISFK